MFASITLRFSYIQLFAVLQTTSPSISSSVGTSLDTAPPTYIFRSPRVNTVFHWSPTSFWFLASIRQPSCSGVPRPRKLEGYQEINVSHPLLSYPYNTIRSCCCCCYHDDGGDWSCGGLHSDPFSSSCWSHHLLLLLLSAHAELLHDQTRAERPLRWKEPGRIKSSSQATRARGVSQGLAVKFNRGALYDYCIALR